jgi:predicted NBD/HSP70 family sugar kinase
MQRNLIVEVGPRQTVRGKPPIDLEINPEGAFSIGVVLSRDCLIGVLVNLSGIVIKRVRYEVHFPTPDETIPLMKEMVAQLSKNSGVTKERLWGVGVGVPGPLDIRAGAIIQPPNFPGWDKVPIVDLLSANIDLPVYLQNNATAAAIGENWYGVGQYARNFFYIYFGIGLGGGLIIDGQPYQGFNGNAGAFGYTPITDLDNEGNCTSMVRLGEYVSMGALYKLLNANGIKASNYTDLDMLCKNKNPVLVKWLDISAHYLAPAMMHVELYFDPETIVFGGHLPESLVEKLISRLEMLLPRFRPPGKIYKPNLICAAAGEDAAALGVATLPIHEALSPSHKLLLKRPRAAEQIGGL